jgi:hypothetical protein
MFLGGSMACIKLIVNNQIQIYSFKEFEDYCKEYNYGIINNRFNLDAALYTCGAIYYYSREYPNLNFVLSRNKTFNNRQQLGYCWNNYNGETLKFFLYNA